MSISNITYLSQFVPFEFYAFTNAQFAWFYFSDIIEIKFYPISFKDLYSFKTIYLK
jgi:hypothetical protein